MDYASLVKTQVRQAFEKIGTLATDAVLAQSNSTGFDFATQVTNKSAALTSSIKIVVSSTSRAKAATNTIECDVIVIDGDVIDLQSYDTLAFSGNTWNIVKPVKSDGYVVTTKLTREYHG
jgi:alpha-N-acetylglucosamine transferase